MTEPPSTPSSSRTSVREPSGADGSPAWGAPNVVLNRIEKIVTYEVMATDLETLDAIVSGENQALAFLTGSAGLAIPMLVSAAVTDNLTPTALAWYLCVGGVTTVGAIWFFVSWIRARKQRPRLLAKMRGTARGAIGGQ